MSTAAPQRIRPMLAKLERELPRGDFTYEPKWDGFRCLAFRDGIDVDLRSRHGRPLGRYFPELVAALRAVPAPRFAVDGEIVVVTADRLDFVALMARLHPAASRVELLRAQTPATFVAFDLLQIGDDDVLETPFRERRARLEQLLAQPPGAIRLTTATAELAVARQWLDEFEGVIAKHASLPYVAGKRAMVKVKRERTADCVVAGMRWLVDRPLPSSLLLGLYDEAGALHHVGITSAFSEQQRHAVLNELGPMIVELEGHPWERGFLLTGGSLGRLKGAAGRWTPEMEREWTPLDPKRVVEVTYDQVDGLRFRHPARFKRWRPDREPRSCELDQLASPARSDAAQLLG